MPLIRSEAAVSIDVQAVEQIGRRVVLTGAQQLGAAEEPVPIGVQRAEEARVAVPFGSRDPPIAIHVEIAEPIVTVVVTAEAQELAAGDRAVAIEIHSPEQFR